MPAFHAGELWYMWCNCFLIYFCLQKVCKNPEFLQLDVEQLGKLLSRDDLNVPSEQDVFHALMAWVHYDLENREENIVKLLPLVRLPLLPPSVSDFINVCLFVLL